MKKWMRTLLSILMCGAFATGSVACSWLDMEDASSQSGNSTSSSGTSSSSSGGSADDEEQTGAMDVITGKFTDRVITDANTAILAVQDVAQQLGLKNATEELTAQSTDVVGDCTYYRLQQNYQGIPVYGGDFVVLSDTNGEAKGVVGNACAIDKSIALTPTVNADTVQANVSETLDIPVFCPQPKEEDLVIYYDEEREQNVLAYAMQAFSFNGKYAFIVDAQSGVVLQYSAQEFAFFSSVQEMLEERVDVYDADEYAFCVYMLTLDGVDYYFCDEFLYNASGNACYKLISGAICNLDNEKANLTTAMQKEELIC